MWDYNPLFVKKKWTDVTHINSSDNDHNTNSLKEYLNWSAKKQ